MPYKTIKTVKVTLQALVILALAGCDSKDQHLSEPVKIIGEMKNVMWKGELDGNIHLDTITNKTHLYGLGPIEYLRGEILILDGKAYRSTVVTEEIMQVEESYDLKAPFFAYTHISQWREQTLPDSVETMRQLEQYLDQVTQSALRPFMFRLSGTVEEALIHVVNLPEGSAVSSPEEAHQGQVDYKINDRQSDILGFFSTEHQTIFTHHDTFLHMHLITADRQMMGHLDDVVFAKGSMKLHLPVQ